MAEKGRNYRGWTPHEDAKLVEALVVMVNEGLDKADNGFKPGYLQHVETVLKASLPNAGILAKPHIESRIKTMKKDWQAVYDMVIGTNTSSFGYDNVNKCGMVTEPTVWESFISVYKVAAKWRNKPFPILKIYASFLGKIEPRGIEFEISSRWKMMQTWKKNRTQLKPILTSRWKLVIIHIPLQMCKVKNAQVFALGKGNAVLIRL